MIYMKNHQTKGKNHREKKEISLYRDVDYYIDLPLSSPRIYTKSLEVGDGLSPSFFF